MTSNPREFGSSGTFKKVFELLLNGGPGYKSVILIKSHRSHNLAAISYIEVKLNLFLKVWEVATRTFSEK